jgi:DNA gyrase/topoisomerase IV subunit B
MDEPNILSFTILEGVRKKPHMYFGCSGSQAIVEMVRHISKWLVRENGIDLPGTLSVQIEEIPDSSTSTITVTLDGPRAISLPTTLKLPPPDDYPRYVAAGSSFMTADISHSGKRHRFETERDGEIHSKESSPSTETRAKIVFQPYLPTFGNLNEADLYKCAGILESIAILNPGLAVTFGAGPSIRFAWSYSQGLKSYIQKGDHSRWSLHPGTLGFSAKKEGVSVEGHLRFVHAGSSWMQSWINGYPSFGGSHYQGLGDVLAQMFPDPDQGCRRVAFITNSDTGDWIWLPHCFIGAMKLTLARPRYAGPTKDILLDPEVREFVKTAAGASLPGQWPEVQRRRPKPLF